MKRTMSLVLVLALGLIEPVAKADFTFGKPTNLGPTLNSSASEYDMCISTDGLLLIFGSPRPGGVGDVDMWVTMRATINDPWEEPLNLGRMVNSEYNDTDPSLSTDGLSLFFRSDGRPGGYGGKDLWLTTRLTEDDPWREPVNLGPTVNSSYDEGDPSISGDGLSLYFGDYTRPRPGGYGGCDIWITTRPTTNEPWSEPVNLGSTVNSASNDFHQSISADGLTLFFCSNRGGLGDYDLYMTRRATTSDPWGEPENLGPTVNSGFQDANPEISYDGSILYFDSTRSPGFGRDDLWQVPIIPIVDFNGDGIVELKDFSKLAQYWQQNEQSVDIAPPIGNGIVDVQDVAALAEYWLTAPEIPPAQARNPSPADGATNVDINADLRWTAGAGAASHDVYFGTNSPGTLQVNQTGTTFDPGPMAKGTTYYWRIDEVNAWGTTTGQVWTFKTTIGGR